MSDNYIDDITLTDLEAIAAFEHHGQFVFACMGGDGELHTSALTRNKLAHVATVILKGNHSAIAKSRLRLTIRGRRGKFRLCISPCV